MPAESRLPALGRSSDEELRRWAEKIREGDWRALARAATAAEEQSPDAAALLRELFPHTGSASIIGVTGVPGAGKSTLVDRLTVALREDGQRVGILAVDPTSPYTGGAILGDRIRMQRHEGDAGVFIRSMATRGHLGGLAGGCLDVALLMDTAGCDVVLVETVGAGQAEVDVARLADATVVVLVPGLGDDVQSLKAGIMEIADVFVINKADRPGAGQLERELESLLDLAEREDGWQPPVFKVVATEGTGVREALAGIRECAGHARESDRSARLWEQRLRRMFRDRLTDSLPEEAYKSAARQVAARERDPYSVVDEWVRLLLGEPPAALRCGKQHEGDTH